MAESPEATPSEPGIHLFTIAGIRIIIDYSWFIIFFLVALSLSAGYLPQEYPDQSRVSYWIAGLVGTLAFFASIVFHELAHSLVAIRSGIQIPSITLFLFGGVSRLSEEAKSPQTELSIAIVGPLSSFLLAGLFGLVKLALEGVANPLVLAIVTYLAWINLALGIFNLVPGFPLDGGRVLRAIWWRKTGSLDRATKLVSDLGKGFAVFLMFLGALQVFSGALLGGIWLIFIGMFLRGTAEQGYQQLGMMRMLESVTVGDVMVREPVTVRPDASLSELVNAYFLRFGYRGFPVVEAGKPIGVVSLSNLNGIGESELPARSVRNTMDPLEESSTISPQATLLEALNKLSGRSSAGRLLVLDEGELVGLLTKTGLVRLLEMRRILNRRGEGSTTTESIPD